MNKLSKVCRSALAVVSLASACPACAILLNPGDTVIYNFDFTAASPPPPYFGEQANIFFTPGLFDFDLVFFDELNGKGSIALSLPHVVGVDNVGVGVGEPGLNDGTFSIGITANVPLELVSVSGFGFADGGLAFVDATAVPEPASWPLLAIGALAAGVIRRRRYAPDAGD